MAVSGVHDPVRTSPLFDAVYYRQAYGHLLADRADPMRHFVEVGLEQGYLPSAAFDPVLYRVLVPECGRADPLLHCEASGKAFEPAPLSRIFPRIASAVTLKAPRTGGNKEARSDDGWDAAAARDIPFAAEGGEYVLRVPEPEAVLERLRKDQPFTFARLPHGFWDAVWMVDVAEKAIAADVRTRSLNPAQRRALATRLCAAVRPGHGGFAPLFMEEVLADIPVHAGRDDFFRAVAFNGSPTPDEDVYGKREKPSREDALRLFSAHFRPGERIYDGKVWKRLLIAGQLRELPDLCRSAPVVLVANRAFSELGARWRLADFTYLEIPPALTQWRRYELLARTTQAVSAACARAGRPPVVLTQCGASLAYWLFTRLFERFPRVFYLDLGQALNGWFFDNIKVDAFPWMRAYARAVIASCDLEPFYRALKGADYEAWFESLP